MKRITVLILSFALLLLVGCTNTPKENPTQTNPSETSQASGEKPNAVSTNHTPSAENLLSTVQYISQDDVIYTCPATCVRCYDASSGDAFVPCSQAGCKHNSSECGAFVGDRVNGFALYRGSFYALVQPSGEAWRLVNWSFDRGSETVAVLDLPGGEAVVQDFIFTVNYTGGWAVVNISWQEQELLQEGLEISYQYYDVSTCLAIHLESGSICTIKPVVRTDGNFQIFDHSFEVLGGWDGKLLLKTEDYAEQTTFCSTPYGYAKHMGYDISPNDWEALNDLTPEWEAYMESFNPGKADTGLVLYDLATGDRETVVAPGEANGWNFGSDTYSKFYDDALIFYKGNELWSISAVDGAQRLLFTAEAEIINYWLSDHKVWLIQSDEAVTQKWGFFDMDALTYHAYGNGGNAEYWNFNNQSETTHYFIGNYDGRQCIISKEEYYAESYDNARPASLPQLWN